MAGGRAAGRHGLQGRQASLPTPHRVPAGGMRAQRAGHAAAGLIPQPRRILKWRVVVAVGAAGGRGGSAAVRAGGALASAWSAASCPARGAGLGGCHAAQPVPNPPERVGLAVCAPQREEQQLEAVQGAGQLLVLRAQACRPGSLGAWLHRCAAWLPIMACTQPALWAEAHVAPESPARRDPAAHPATALCPCSRLLSAHTCPPRCASRPSSHQLDGAALRHGVQVVAGLAVKAGRPRGNQVHVAVAPAGGRRGRVHGCGGTRAGRGNPPPCQSAANDGGRPGSFDGVRQPQPTDQGTAQAQETCMGHMPRAPFSI